MHVRPHPAGALRHFSQRLDALRDEVAAQLAGPPGDAERRAEATLALCRLMFGHFLGGGAAPVEQPGSLPREAIARAQELFDSYAWSLRASDAADAITPDALGAFFERSLERKQSGAYYTQADVADYIARATIVPWVLEEAARLRPQTFGAGGAVWRLLSARPERYIPPDMRHGADLPLPPEIAAGLSNPAARAAWDAPAAASHGLTAETWREALARHARCRETRALLAGGGAGDPSALITHNLDMLQLALDAVASCADAADLRALWGAVSGLRLLDPTCGAGAFLVAAARVLAPLYRACLERMADFADDPLLASVAPAEQRGWAMRAALRENLHGVDLMPAAAEVCRMRLALEAAAAGGDALECLADLRANIRAGDALLGPVGEGDEAGAAEAIDWRAAFGPAMRRGGFDVVIGNPPYLGVPHAKRAYEALGYRTAACGNLYALVVERSLALLRDGGRLGMIVPVASVSTDAMRPLQELYAPYEQWHSHYAVRPARLFDGVDMNLTITLLRKTPGACYVGGYRRWTGGPRGDRRHLFTTLGYTRNPRLAAHANPYPKLGAPIEAAILERMLSFGVRLRDYVTSEGVTLYYHSGGRYWRKALPARLSSHYRPLTVAAEVAPVVFGLLNSQLFYWYWITNSNCMDLVAREVLELPVFPLERADAARFAELQAELLAAYEGGRSVRVRRGARIRATEVNYDLRRARPAIDRIDALLADCYGLDAEQLDFIRSYDLKHRARLLRDAAR